MTREPFSLPRRRPFATAGLAALAFAAACGSASVDEAPRRVELDSAAVRVLAVDERLYEVRDVMVAGRAVWVLSGHAPYVYRYASADAHAQAFGRQGRGPGELLNPWNLVAAGEPGAVEVWDVAARQLVRFDPTGRLTATVPVPIRSGGIRGDIREVSFGDPLRIRAARGGPVVQVPLAPVSQTRDLYSSALVQLGADGSPRDTIARFSTMAMSMAGQTLVPIPLWTACPDGRLVVFDPSGPALQWYDGGRVGTRVQLPIAQRAFTEADARRYLGHMLDLEARAYNYQIPNRGQMVDAALARGRGQFGTIAPPAVDMLCDAHARVWLETFSSADHPLGYGREWTVFDGLRLVAVVRFPRGFRPMELATGTAAGSQTDPDGVQRPALLPLPPSLH